MEHEASQKHGMETHLIGSSCKNLLWLELIMVCCFSHYRQGGGFFKK